MGVLLSRKSLLQSADPAFPTSLPSCYYNTMKRSFLVEFSTCEPTNGRNDHHWTATTEFITLIQAMAVHDNNMVHVSRNNRGDIFCRSAASRGRYTHMRCLCLTNAHYSKNCFARDNFAPNVFIVELPKFHNTYKYELYQLSVS